VKITVTLDQSHRDLRLHLHRALDYRREHVVRLVATALDDARTPRSSNQDIRERVLRALDDGATQAAAATRFGVDPALIHRWDDDAALDAHLDLLADAP